jgi:hypothetical protein
VQERGEEQKSTTGRCQPFENTKIPYCAHT